MGLQSARSADRSWCCAVGSICSQRLSLRLTSKFKAVNNRDKNFTPNKIQRRMEQIEASIDRYMAAMDAADRQEGEVAQAKSARLKDKIASLKQQMQQFRELQQAVQAAHASRSR